MARQVVRWLAVAVTSASMASGVVVGAGVGSADPAFPPSFPQDQNQLPQLPKESDLYKALPIATPNADDWYRDPPNLASLQPGAIIRERIVNTPLLGLRVPIATTQLLFRSTDLHGNPIATATSVIVPSLPWTEGARPVVSVQEAIDSADQSCNPSHTLQVGTFKETSQVSAFLSDGFAVNVPDFDGKYNTFSTFDEGHMVLDSLRAMKNSTSLRLDQSKIALYGYSGGGSGTIRAAELRKTYAPDVLIEGAAFGGTPSNLNTLVDYAATPHPGLDGAASFTMWLGAKGLSKNFPDVFDPKRILNDEGQQLLADISGRCLYSAVGTGIYRPIGDYLAPGRSLQDPDVQEVLTSQSLGKHIPDIPLLWTHGVEDELIPLATVRPGVETYWAAGADLRYLTLPTTEHVVTKMAGWGPSAAWVSNILRGGDAGPKFKIDSPSSFPEGFPGT